MSSHAVFGLIGAISLSISLGAVAASPELSSAIFNFLPKFALDFYAAVRRRDHAAVNAGLRDFVSPYIAIRRCEPICP